jgi:DNA repair protein RadA/Sms
MAADGLREVADPGAAFIETESLGAPGVAVAATLEGSRPLLVEVQALVAPQVHGSPRRTASGLDSQRLALLIAVLGRRAGINLASHDVYASIVGGLAIEEPAIDLPLALALASALRDWPLIPGTVLCGEIGLTGELRPINNLGRRLREAARLGFTRAIVPRQQGRGETHEEINGIEVIRVATLRDAIAAALTEQGRNATDEPVRIPIGEVAS